MDRDIQVIKHYLELFIKGQPITNVESRKDCLGELESACESLSDRLVSVEAGNMRHESDIKHVTESVRAGLRP